MESIIQNGIKKMRYYLSSNLIIFLYLIFFVSTFSCQTGRGPGLGSGETFRILAYPQGIGTLLVFYAESELRSEKVKFEVAMLEEQYGERLRIRFINAAEKKILVERHRVSEIPTIILFDQIGTEFHRWLVWDFRYDFSKKDLKRVIDKLIVPPLQNNQN
jgi:hypothetical protein